VSLNFEENFHDWEHIGASLRISMGGDAVWCLWWERGPPSQFRDRHQYVNSSIRPQDDLYRYLNGKWLDEFQIPADKGRYVAFTAVEDRTQDQLHSIVDDLARQIPAAGTEAGAADSAARSEERKWPLSTQVSWDEPRLESLASSRSSIPLRHRACRPR